MIDAVCSLQCHQYVFIGRRAIFWGHIVQWAFWCSCDASRASLIISLSHHVETGSLNIKDECIHIRASKIIMEEVDTLLDISPNMDYIGKETDHFVPCIFQDILVQITTTHRHHLSKLGRYSYTCMHGAPVTIYLLQHFEGFYSVGVEPALCVNVNGDFGVLCLGHKATFCSTCKHSSNCKHIHRLNSVIENTPIDELPSQFKVLFNFKTPAVQPANDFPHAVSIKKIPFSYSRHMKQTLMADYSKRFNIEHGTAHLHPTLPSSSVCSGCGIPGSWSAELTPSRKSFLVTPHRCYPVEGKKRG